MTGCRCNSAEAVAILLLLLNAVAKLSAAGGALWSFPAQEVGPTPLITTHGVGTVHYGEDMPNRFSNDSGKDRRAAIAPDDDYPDTEAVGSWQGPLEASRAKRLIISEENRKWDKAIVPYTFAQLKMSPQDRAEVMTAVTRFQRYTCARFVPWSENATRLKYGLPDESHVLFDKKRDICSSKIGNWHRISGQRTYCCDRDVCTHQLGHILGLLHDHQSPTRYQYLRANWNESMPHVRPNWAETAVYGTRFLYDEYDLASSMHDPAGPGFQILYEDLAPLLEMDNQFYMYKEIASYYDCKGLYCSDFQKECVNDGFVTLVDGVCACLCPPGLDPKYGCARPIQSVPFSVIWPVGTYSLFAPATGCPGSGVFSTGWWQHWGQGNNRQSSDVNLAGEYTPESFRHVFCTKSDVGNVTGAPEWEPGRYCILRAGGDCPDGFAEGFLQFNHASGHEGQGNTTGLPGGTFSDGTTRLEFCCRDDGYTITPLIKLPNTEPLILFPNSHDDSNCQEIGGMRWKKEFLQFDSMPVGDGFGGEYPYGLSASELKLYYCYYTPLQCCCGGFTKLTPSNREVIITSPDFPMSYRENVECTWLIEAEKDSNILLNFDYFKIPADNNTCQDSLEIRYNIPGQPGLRFCGEGLTRTIRSMKNIVVLTFRSDYHQVSSNSGFRLRATLFSPEEEQCFSPVTNGVLYRGEKSYTRGMKPCLPWSRTTQCRYHTFNSKSFWADLNANYCRNPDNTAMPWCYTSVDDCQRDYCDVCNIERVYDTSPLCHDSDVCSNSTDSIIAAGCASTCNITHPPAPIIDKRCRAPEELPDSIILGQKPVTGGRQGRVITYRCRTGSETATSVCLSTGQWDNPGYVCGACSPGWAFHNGSCYRVFDSGLVAFSKAQEVCRKHHAEVSSVINQDEEDFVTSLRNFQWKMWIGATDIETEGTFVWQDGTPVEWTHWKASNPNNYQGQDCVAILPKQDEHVWDDVDCDELQPLFICKYTLSERTYCRDRAKACSNALAEDPEACTNYTEWAEEQCPKTCGICTDFDAETSNSSDVAIVEGDGVNTATNQTVLGLGNKLSVKRSGIISKWIFYSEAGRTLYFQAWKPSDDFYKNSSASLKFYLIGQNTVTSTTAGLQVYDVPVAEAISVQRGDRLALWEATGAVHYRVCDGSESSRDYAVATSETRSAADFSVVDPVMFSSKGCYIYSFKAEIHPSPKCTGLS